MNRKGFIDFDDLNPAYLALSVLSAVLMFGILAYWTKSGSYVTGLFAKIFMPILSFVITYIYLNLTD